MLDGETLVLLLSWGKSIWVSQAGKKAKRTEEARNWLSAVPASRPAGASRLVWGSCESTPGPMCLVPKSPSV